MRILVLGGLACWATSEANALYGAPTITLDDWRTMPSDARGGMPH